MRTSSNLSNSIATGLSPILLLVFLPSKKQTDVKARIIVDMEEIVEMRLWTHLLAIFGGLKRGPSQFDTVEEKEEWRLQIKGRCLSKNSIL